MSLNLNRTENDITRLERQKINANWAMIERNFNDVFLEVTGDAFNQVVDAAKLIWKSPVATFNDLATTYPDAEEGWTALVLERVGDVSKVYRYTDGEWLYIQAIQNDTVTDIYNELIQKIEDDELEQASGILTRQRPLNHNAFTDVVYNTIHNIYAAVYRGAQTHVGSIGVIYYTTSTDGANWSTPQVIITNTLDCRDPSIALGENGNMLINYFLFNSGVGSVQVAEINVGGTVLSDNRISSNNAEFCTSPIVKFENKYYLMTYGTNVMNLYMNEQANTTGFQLTKTFNLAPNLAASEPEIFVSNGTLNTFIRSDSSINANIYYINDILTNSTPIATQLPGKQSGVFETGDDLLIGVRYLSPFVYYGEFRIYRIDKTTYQLKEQFLVDNSWDNDVAYASFASKDNKELVISYYTKLLGSGAQIKIIKTKVSQFTEKKILIDASHPLSAHEKPHVLTDEGTGQPVLTLLQLNALGQFQRMVDNDGDILMLISKLNKNATINSPSGNLYLNNNGGSIYFGNGAGEINTANSWVIRGSIDARGVSTFYNARGYRIPGDNTSGSLPVALRDVGTTANRPMAGIPTGHQYYNTDLFYLQTYTGSTYNSYVPDLSGNGSPEGVVSARIGRLYRDESGGNLYIKETGIGNVGWKGLTKNA